MPDPQTEQAFQQWYATRAAALGLNPNPDDPRHFYDYRAAFRAGAEPDASGHWPSAFKREGHPRLFVDGIDTRTGKPVLPGTGIDSRPSPDPTAVAQQLPGTGIGPSVTPPPGTSIGPESWLSRWRMLVKDIEEGREKSLPAQVLGSAPGQMLAALIEPGGGKLNFPPEREATANFHAASDAASALPLAAPRKRWQDAGAKLNEAYTDLSDQGLAARPSELLKLRNQVAQRQATLPSTLGAKPRGTDVGETIGQVQKILGHLQTQQRYQAKPEDLQTLLDLAQRIKISGEGMTNKGQGRATPIPRLGEIARALANQLNMQRSIADPLLLALRRGTGWAALDNAPTGAVSGANKRTALLQQMKEE